MDHQEDYSVTSRAEYIKLARESCARNLHGAHINGKHNSSMKVDNRRTKLNLYNRRSNRDSYDFSRGEFDISNTSLKLFVIRAICALMLFLTVLLIDKLNIEFKGVSSESIKELVSSNKGIEEAEDFFVSLFEKGEGKDNKD